MRHPYLAVLDTRPGSDGMPPSALADYLEQRGLLPRWHSGSSVLYASDQTPLIELGPGTVLIGELYFRDGQRLQYRHQLPDLRSRAMLRNYVFSQCWGEYVLVQAVAGDARAIEVTRSPSHACEAPCLYAVSDGTAFFTSDVSLAYGAGLHRRQINFNGLAHRLAYPDIKLASSALAGVDELLPGHGVVASQGKTAVTRHWDPWAFVESRTRFQDLDQAVSAVHGSVTMVTKALADRHQTAMVELSGGLDSSIVAASLRASSASVHCATMMSSLPGADERDYASAVARMLGSPLLASELMLEGAVFEFVLPPSATSPSIGPLQYALDRLMESSARQTGAEAAFCGAGGDSVFGYLTSAAPAADAYRALGPRAALRALRDVATFHQCTYWKAGALALRKVRNPYPPPDRDLSLLPPKLAPDPPTLHPWDQRPPEALAGDVQRIHELAGAQTFQDSCLRSLVRPLHMPLLSQPVIETCLRVPSWMWFTGGHNRAVARMAFTRQLPDSVIARRSKGSLTSYLGALHRRQQRAITRFLVDGQLEANGLLDADALLRLQDQEIQEERGFLRVFQLCMVENWARQQARFI